MFFQLLLCEALDPDLDFNVLDIIFGGQVLPKLEAVDCMLPSRFIHYVLISKSVVVPVATLSAPLKKCCALTSSQVPVV